MTTNITLICAYGQYLCSDTLKVVQTKYFCYQVNAVIKIKSKISTYTLIELRQKLYFNRIALFLPAYKIMKYEEGYKMFEQFNNLSKHVFKHEEIDFLCDCYHSGIYSLIGGIKLHGERSLVFVIDTV